MDLHHKLRHDTKAFHDQMEKSSLFKKIISKDISLDEYKLLIKKLHAFITSCENIIIHQSNKSLLKNREKTALLEDDLRALHLNYCQRTIDKCAGSLPSLANMENILGYLYVIEGSTLGGQIITKLLSKQLNISTTHGAKFFYAYGNKTKFMWDIFCESLNSMVDLTQQNKIIMSAISTYKALHNWMEEYTFKE